MKNFCHASENDGAAIPEKQPSVLTPVHRGRWNSSCEGPQHGERGIDRIEVYKLYVGRMA